MQCIGIYGGTFNPPHIGHIRAAQQAAQMMNLDRVLLIPTGISPHKAMPENAPTAQQRMQMLCIAAQNLPKLTVSDMELRREGISYTWETVCELKKRYPDAQFTLLMGTDMFLSFPTWKCADQIAQTVSLAVFYRGEKGERDAIDEQMPVVKEMGADVTIVRNDVTAISSTQLRRLLAFGCADDFLPDGVVDFIRQNRLYDTASDWKNLPMDKLERVVVRLLDPKRVAHVLGCRDTAVELTHRWGENESDAARAGILHDITKALDGPLQLTLCGAYGKILDDFSKKYPKTLHALTGSLVAERIFGENDAVVSAICHHTTGRANMTLLEKIIYVADYMEPNRDFPGVEKLRELAFSNIDAALKLGLEMTLEHLSRQKSEISPATREALRYLNQTNLENMNT